MTDPERISRSTPIDAISVSAVPGSGRDESTTLAQPKVKLPAGFRSANWLFITFTVSLLAFIAPVWIVATLSVGGHTPNGKPVAAGARIGFVVWLAIGLFVMYRFCRVRVVTTDDEMIVFNLVHTHRVRWSDIQYLEMNRVKGGKGGPQALVAVTQTNGERFWVSVARVSYSSRAKTLKPILDACAAHGVKIDDWS